MTGPDHGPNARKPFSASRAARGLLLLGGLALWLASCVPATAPLNPAAPTDRPDPVLAQNTDLLRTEQLPELQPGAAPKPLAAGPVAPPLKAFAPAKALRLPGLKEAPPKATDIPEFPTLDDLEVEARLERLSKLPPSLGLDIVRTGLTQKGRRYRWGGTAPSSGFDCSGFTQWTFKQHGINLPRTAKEQFGEGIHIRQGELRAGDLVFYKINRRGRWHVGIYMDDGVFVHSPRRGRNICEGNMSDAYWVKRYMGARRYTR